MKFEFYYDCLNDFVFFDIISRKFECNLLNFIDFNEVRKVRVFVVSWLGFF